MCLLMFGFSTYLSDNIPGYSHWNPLVRFLNNAPVRGEKNEQIVRFINETWAKQISIKKQKTKHWFQHIQFSGTIYIKECFDEQTEIHTEIHSACVSLMRLITMSEFYTTTLFLCSAWISYFYQKQISLKIYFSWSMWMRIHWTHATMFGH